jgi:hypothetical protein
VRQDIAVGYWRDLLERPLTDLAVGARSRLAASARSRCSLPGNHRRNLEPPYRDWLASQLPQGHGHPLRDGQLPYVGLLIDLRARDRLDFHELLGVTEERNSEQGAGSAAEPFRNDRPSSYQV